MTESVSELLLTGFVAELDDELELDDEPVPDDDFEDDELEELR